MCSLNDLSFYLKKFVYFYCDFFMKVIAMRNFPNRLLFFGIASFVCLQLFSQELPRRPFIGIQLGDITIGIQSRFNLPMSHGPIISQVFPQSSAEAAQLIVGDVIVSLNDQKMKDTQQFLFAIKNYTTGDIVKLGIFREGKSFEILMELKGFPIHHQPYGTTELTSVKANGNHHRVIITIPEHIDFPAPVLFILPTVGCNTLESIPGNPSIYQAIVDSFTYHGYATIRMERSGVGDSKGEPCETMSFDAELDALELTYELIDQYDALDVNNVFLFGHGIGAISGALLSQHLPFRGMVAYGTIGRNYPEWEWLTTRKQFELANIDDVVLDDAMNLELQRIYLQYVEKYSTDEVRKKIPEIEEQFKTRIHSDEFYYQLAQRNIPQVWKDSNVRLLIVHGMSDYLTFQQDHRRIADLVNTSRPRTAAYFEFSWTDHRFNKAFTEVDSFEKSTSEKNYALIPLLIEWTQQLIVHPKELVPNQK